MLKPRILSEKVLLQDLLLKMAVKTGLTSEVRVNRKLKPMNMLRVCQGVEKNIDSAAYDTNVINLKSLILKLLA